jgi:hypothetical protein
MGALIVNVPPKKSDGKKRPVYKLVIRVGGLELRSSQFLLPGHEWGL